MKRVVKLPVGIPADLVPDVLARLHYSSSDLEGFRLDLEHNCVEYTQRGEESAAEVERKILKVIDKMTDGFKRRRTRILVDRRSVSPRYVDDPMPELERGGHVRKAGIGQYAFGPLTVRLAAYFEEEFARIGTSLGAVPYRFPTLIDVQKLSRCGYFSSFSQSACFVTHLREDVDVIEAFADAMGRESTTVNPASGQLATTEHMLSPAVCFHLYAALADRPLSKPLMVAMAQGKCFRYESGNLTGLERLWDFSMHEVMFVGPSDEVVTLRQRSMDLFVEFMDSLQMRYRIETAIDPFFIGDYATRGTFQSALELKYEIRLDLPFRKTSIAAGSFNYHQTFFGKSFRIGLSSSSHHWVHSGCTAMGIERWVFGFLAQYGPDPVRWPAIVRQRVVAA